MAVGSSYTGDPVNVGDYCTIIGTVANVSGNNINVTTVSSLTNITVPFQGTLNAPSNINGSQISGAAKLANPNLIPVGEKVSVKGTVTSVGAGGFKASINVLLADAVTTVTVQAGDVYSTQNS